MPYQATRPLYLQHVGLCDIRLFPSPTAREPALQFPAPVQAVLYGLRASSWQCFVTAMLMTHQIRCRQTKAKCEISADSSACVKCLRERRECVFTAERSTKKRKFSFVDVGASTPRCSQLTPSQGNLLQPGQVSNSTTSVSSPVKQDQTQQATRTNGNDRPPAPPRSNTVPEDYESDVVHTVVSTSHDALGLLFKAVEQHVEADDSRPRSAPDLNDEDNSPATVSSIRGLPIATSRLVSPSQEVLALWKQHRFVRQGWLSPIEAATYVDL